MFWIALAARLVAAQPVEAASWFSDLPWQQLVSAKGGHALNFVRVIVEPNGKPSDCKIETTSGIPALDSNTCSLIMKQGMFRPARWPDGSAAYGVFRKDFLWADLDEFKYARPVDVEIAVSKLPKGIRAPVSFTLTFAVDASGTKSGCEPPDRMDSALAAIACKQIVESYPVIPAHNSAGVPVASIQNAIVSFVTQ